jgi:hypothetical protein
MDDMRGFRQSVHLWWNGEYKVHDVSMYFDQRWTSRACHSVVDYLRQYHWKLIMALISPLGYGGACAAAPDSPRSRRIGFVRPLTAWPPSGPFRQRHGEGMGHETALVSCRERRFKRPDHFDPRSDRRSPRLGPVGPGMGRALRCWSASGSNTRVPAKSGSGPRYSSRVEGGGWRFLASGVA